MRIHYLYLFIISTMKVKYYNLKKWDKAQHWNELLTFEKVDWMYAHFIDKDWNLRIWNSWEYEEKNWIYYPVE